LGEFCSSKASSATGNLAPCFELIKQTGSHQKLLKLIWLWLYSLFLMDQKRKASLCTTQ